MKAAAHFFLATAIVLVGAMQTSAAEPARKPNIIVFLVDDMGWMDCGAYGSKYYETPNMDRFATRGMRFTDAYAQPLCSPTRACLLTGKHAARHGITTASGHQPPQAPDARMLPESAPPTQPMLLPESRNYLEPKEYTLAEALRDAGYRTAHIGKWHLGLTKPHWPEQQGFDVAFHCHPDPGPPGNYFSPYGVVAEGTPTAKIKVGTITDGPPGEYIVDRQAAEAEKFMEANKDRPFFLNLWCYGVHGPWGHKEEYTKNFQTKKDPRSVQGNPIMASMLKSVDECFGRIVDTVDRLGLAEETIIVFNSDNGGNVHSNLPGEAKTERAAKNKGEQLGDWRKWAGDQPPTINTPLRDGKGTLYEGGTRVPLMWAWAGHIKPGAVSEAVVGHIDLYPTLMEMAGLRVPTQQKIDGISYANVLKGEGGLKREAFFNYFPHGRSPGRAGGASVRAGDWKLIRWFGLAEGDPARHELYNLRNDLGEAKNLAGSEPERVKQMDAMIEASLQDTGATYPRPNPAYKGAAPSVKPATKRVDLPLQGWVPKFSKASIAEGVMRVEGQGRRPFLGNTQVKHQGPAMLQLRARAVAGGTGQVQWRTADQETFPAEGQTVSFVMKPGEALQDISVSLPVEGQLVHFRLHLPADKSPVEIREVKFLDVGSGKLVRGWDFSVAK